uniref:Ninjurin 1 n=1 Tax=Oryzias latipes TaxID=8090 RepID=A0A3P9LH60_ORYLA
MQFAQGAKSPHPMDYNMYATKKSAAKSMLDIALLMANSSQMKTVLSVGPEYNFYLPLIVLLALSITLQVVVGLLLIFIAKDNLNDQDKHLKLDHPNNTATIFVFFTVIIKTLITSAFGSRNGGMFQGRLSCHGKSCSEHNLVWSRFS